MKVHGFAHAYGDNVNTDVIIPARYLNSSDPATLAAHCMEDIDRAFSVRCKQGDLVVGGKNFGCGSSREHAPIALKAAGVSCVIASDFARIFYRNSINIGLPILESPEAAGEIQTGDEIAVDFSVGLIENKTTGKSYRAHPFPPFLEKIIADGGLLRSIQKEQTK